MKVIQVREVPDALHRELCRRAAAAGVSLSDYALAELERVAARPSVHEVLVRAQSRPGGTPAGAAGEAVRVGRDRA